MIFFKCFHLFFRFFQCFSFKKVSLTNFLLASLFWTTSRVSIPSIFITSFWISSIVTNSHLAIFLITTLITFKILIFKSEVGFYFLCEKLRYTNFALTGWFWATCSITIPSITIWTIRRGIILTNGHFAFIFGSTLVAL